jgi:hypothetical protein
MKTKFFLLLILIAVISNFTIAQTVTDYSKLSKQNNIYFGFGTGLNYNCGLIGLKIAGRVSEKVLIDASVGLGTWGRKFGVGVILNAKNENAWCPIISYSRAMGVEQVPLEIEVFHPSSGLNLKGTYEVDYKPANMLNIGVQRQWLRPQGNRITLELGYSILVSGGEYALSDQSNGLKIANTMKPIFDFLKPGGLTVGFGYYFALD